MCFACKHVNTKTDHKSHEIGGKIINRFLNMIFISNDEFYFFNTRAFI